MQSKSIHFKKNVHQNLNNVVLNKALSKAKKKFVGGRSAAITRYEESLGNFEQLRDAGHQARKRSIDDWSNQLQVFERNAIANGAQVHWAITGADANHIIGQIALNNGVQKTIKSKSMLSEEIALNNHLESQGIQVVESDLGEYILQLGNEPPSHIVAPAVHKNADQVSELFAQHHPELPRSTDPKVLTHQARGILRERFIQADMGITGANFLIAELGAAGIITNEGNGLLTSSLPKIRVVLVGIEKILATIEDAVTIVELLPRSATGQAISNYVTITKAPLSQNGEGPEQLHFVLVDAGRSDLLGSDYQEMLHCIRCGACMNHCPVYQHIGGHSYGWVYPGPMGSILTPLYTTLQESLDLPHAATLCGQCDVVCPVKIPLPKLLRQLREDQVKQHLRPRIERFSIYAWAWIAQHPVLYHFAEKILRFSLKCLSGKRGWSGAPFMKNTGWFQQRHFPTPKD